MQRMKQSETSAYNLPSQQKKALIVSNHEDFHRPYPLRSYRHLY
jgi:hypothetical protein